MNNIPHANKSFWLAHSGEYIPSPPLRGSIDVDVVIIGGGFTGLSTAYHIRKVDSAASVAVLEGECVAFGASGRLAGLCQFQYLIPLLQKYFMEKKD